MTRRFPQLLNAQEAAAYTGIPYTTLRDMAHRGDVPFVRLPNVRRLWFKRRDLDQLIEACTERPGR